MSHDERPEGGVRLRLGADRRILARSDFTSTYEKGRKAHGQYVTIFAARREGTGAPPWRLGITATRKTGNSAQRNRQRRRVREFFRLRQREIEPGWDIVVNTRRVMNEAEHEGLIRDVERTLGRRRLEINSGSSLRARRTSHHVAHPREASVMESIQLRCRRRA